MTRFPPPFLPATAAPALLSSVAAATRLTDWLPVTPENTCTKHHKTSAAAVDGALPTNVAAVAG